MGSYTKKSNLSRMLNLFGEKVWYTLEISKTFLFKLKSVLFCYDNMQKENKLAILCTCTYVWMRKHFMCKMRLKGSCKWLCLECTSEWVHIAFV